MIGTLRTNWKMMETHRKEKVITEVLQLDGKKKTLIHFLTSKIVSKMGILIRVIFY